MLTGFWPAGTVFHVSWTGVHVNTPCGQFGYQVNIESDPGGHQPGTLRYPLTQTSVTVDYTIPADANTFTVSANTDTFCSAGTLFGLVVVWDAPTTGFCRYGTEAQPNVSATQTVDAAFVDLVLTELGVPELAIVFTILWYTVINIPEMCSSLPPPMPALDLHLLTASSLEIKNLFINLIWPRYCQCKTGTPAPTPPPPPSPTVPVGWPSAPSFPCDEAALCDAITVMRQQLASLQNNMLTVQDLVTAIQRFSVPFGYVGGRQHLNLTGDSSIAISRLVGVQVVISKLPPTQKIFDSNPDYVWDVGWMSVSDPSGMLQQRRIARQSMTWFPENMQEATQFGWHVSPGVELSVVELQPEP